MWYIGGLTGLTAMQHIDVNLLILLIIAGLNAYTAVITRRSSSTITLLEKNTNSIKDALVASTARASLAEGTAAGLAQGRSENKSG